MKKATLPVRVLLVLLSVLLFVQPADAGMSGPSSIKDSRASQKQLDAEKVRLALSSDKVRERLLEMGYNADRLSASLEKLDREELADLASSVDNLESGGLLFELLVIILILYLIVYLVERPGFY